MHLLKLSLDVCVFYSSLKNSCHKSCVFITNVRLHYHQLRISQVMTNLLFMINKCWTCAVQDLVQLTKQYNLQLVVITNWQFKTLHNMHISSLMWVHFKIILNAFCWIRWVKKKKNEKTQRNLSLHGALKWLLTQQLNLIELFVQLYACFRVHVFTFLFGFKEFQFFPINKHSWKVWVVRLTEATMSGYNLLYYMYYTIIFNYSCLNSANLFKHLKI